MLTIRESVNALYAQYGTDNPYEICDYLGVTILETPLHKKMQGFFLRIEEEFFIYINQHQSDREKYITIAHELGHLLLHPHLNSLFMIRNTLMRPEKYEREADLFAAHLLLCDELFDEGNTVERISCEAEIPLYFVQLKWEDISSL